MPPSASVISTRTATTSSRARPTCTRSRSTRGTAASPTTPPTSSSTSVASRARPTPIRATLRRAAFTSSAPRPRRAARSTPTSECPCWGWLLLRSDAPGRRGIDSRRQAHQLLRAGQVPDQQTTGSSMARACTSKTRTTSSSRARRSRMRSRGARRATTWPRSFFSRRSQYYPHAQAAAAGVDGTPLNVRWRTTALGPRDTTDTNTGYQITGGIKGTIASRWDADLSYSYSEGKVIEHTNGGFFQYSKLLPLLNSGNYNIVGILPADQVTAINSAAEYAARRVLGQVHHERPQRQAVGRALRHGLRPGRRRHRCRPAPRESGPDAFGGLRGGRHHRLRRKLRRSAWQPRRKRVLRRGERPAAEDPRAERRDP